MSFEVEFCTGLGVLLAGNGVGVWGSSFSPTDTALVFGALPTAPVSAIGLTPYPVTDRGDVGHFVQAVQFYYRAPSLVAIHELRGLVRGVLQNRSNFDLSGHLVSRCWWQNGGVPLGVDDNSNERSSDSYYFMTGQPVLSH